MFTREICISIIENIYLGNSFENSIEKNCNFSNLSSLNKSFVRMVVLTFLRRNGEIDFVIKSFLKKKPKYDDKLLNILRIGITQILFMDTADYAAVNVSVEISKKKIPNFSSLINALLRRVSREKVKILKNTDKTLNFPNWIKINLKRSFGENKFIKIANLIINKPFLDIKIRKDAFNKKNWCRELGGENIFGEVIRKKETGNVRNIPYFNEGLWWIQSVSATIPVQIIKSQFKKAENIEVLEIGSAPGGKTLNLCENGFKVTAVEISKNRIKKLRENLKRTNFNVKIINQSINFLRMKKKFDCALIDSPCSSSGIIQKKPEILVQKKKLNLEKMIKKQKEILQNTSTFIKIKGIVVYAVCSLFYEEGEKQINEFLKINKNFKLQKINTDVFSKIECEIRNGMIITTPLCLKNKGGLDGFFTACLKRYY